ncbi:MAG: response regulator transcription factor [Bdellovibrionales bacterium]|nr:response regulator transcription factor [Bdellovibrionales bacterium]
MDRRKQILIVEDDEDIKELMEFHLSKDYYIIDSAENGRIAYDKILKNKYDLIIMDWMIPEISGLDIILWMKKPDHAQRKTPVLMVTAKSDPADIVAGLEKGADDYMVKPFDFDVLRARVQNLLKRREFLKSLQASPEKKKKLTFGHLVVDTESHQAILKGETLDLTYSEFRLLEALILNQGKVLSRKQIMSFIQGEEQVVTGRTIDTHIFSLRKKLKAYGSCIHTVRGIGYRVDAEESFL